MPAPPAQPAQTASSTHPARWPYVIVPALHLLAALSGPVYYLYATSAPVIGANIGAGLALMWTAGWGLPWSVVPWNATGVTDQGAFMTFTACALLNVVLVAGLFFLLYRRAAARRPSQAHSVPVRRWHYMLVPALALLSVLAGPLYFWLSYYGSMPGESFGAPIFGEYWNTLVGLPWSMWVWGKPELSLYGPTVCALINVGLITLFFWLAYRRAHRHSMLGQRDSIRRVG